MNLRLVKEARALRLPWSIAVVAGGAMPFLQRWNSSVVPSELLYALATIAFFSSCVLMAAMTFGAELQYRTLTLLLCQPLERRRCWREKLLVQAGALGSAALVYVLAMLLWSPQKSEVVLPLVVLAGVAGAAEFWTLTVRTVIGGAAFAFCGELLAFLVGAGLVRCYYLPHSAPEGAEIGGMGLAGLLYGALFQYLGWRKFARLELILSGGGEGDWSEASRARIQAGRAGWLLRPRPTGPLGNLMRKECRLQKPALLVSLAFVLSWLAAIGICWLWPGRDLEQLFNILVCAQIALLLLLTATTPTGDEKSLGVMAWQLIQPISAARQWGVKLLVGVGFAALLTWGLPLLLTVLTMPFFTFGFSNVLHAPAGDLVTWSLMSAGVFVFGFWASTLVANTTRAALVTVLGLAFAFILMGLGVAAGGQAGGLETGLLVRLVAWRQLSPEAPAQWFESHVAMLVAASVGVVLLVLLWQSFLQFRRPQPESGLWLKRALVLAAMLFGLAFWWGDYPTSCNRLSNSWLQAELSRAMRSLPDVMSRAAQGRYRKVELQELAGTGWLSDRTQHWLKDARIDCAGAVTRPVPNVAVDVHYVVNIQFPSGAQYSFTFIVSSQAAAGPAAPSSP